MTGRNEIKLTLRIPGNWEHSGQLVEQIPAGFRLTPNALILPDGSMHNPFGRLRLVSIKDIAERN